MEDSVDQHVARWRDWDKISFNDEVEGAVTRISMISKYLKRTSKQAAEKSDLQWFEYETLHALMIRDLPGRATPSELATRLMVSPAGITGRLDGMEQRGLLHRVHNPTDRRRVDVEITPEGQARWQRTMQLRGQTEEAMLGVLSETEQHALNHLLRNVLAHLEIE